MCKGKGGLNRYVASFEGGLTGNLRRRVGGESSIWAGKGNLEKDIRIQVYHGVNPRQEKGNRYTALCSSH